MLTRLRSGECLVSNAFFLSVWSCSFQCICQQVFDVESFLQSFLYKYGSLRQLNLVDYDLQLVRVRAQVGDVAAFSCSTTPSSRSFDDMCALTDLGK